MNQKPVQGIYAAVLTPRSLRDEIDVPAFIALIGFLVKKGVRRFAVNGATGEFCLTTPAQLSLLLATLRSAYEDAEILCGVGAGSTTQTLELVAVAQDTGVQSLLLPMPYFFPYAQQDLAAFCKEVAQSTTLPVLLYNLPQFTTGLEAETVCHLCQSVPNIIGIKDSGGSLDLLRALRSQVPEACRIIGNDQALAPALQNDVCDGVVSGVAGVAPELIQSLYSLSIQDRAFARQSAHLDEFLQHLNIFPTPWGLKWIAEERILLNASFALPLSQGRRADGLALKQWFRIWLPTIER